jgi:hypothetical protein
MRASQLFLTVPAVSTIVGPMGADLNATHAFNPAWTPHARFHNIVGVGNNVASGMLALWLLWRPPAGSRERDIAVKVATLLPALAWLPFFAAAAVPGAAPEDDPGSLPRIAGIPINLAIAGFFPSLSAVGYFLHRRETHRAG